MKYLLLLSTLCFCSCAVVYDGNGNKLAEFRGSDLENVSVTKSARGDVSFSASSLKHSSVVATIVKPISQGIVTAGAVSMFKSVPATVDSINNTHPR